MQDRFTRLEEMERYYYSKERRDHGYDYDRRDYDRRDYDRLDYDRRPPYHQTEPYERDYYRSQDRYGRNDPYDMYERGRGGHYMGREDPYGLPPSRHM